MKVIDDITPTMQDILFKRKYTSLTFSDIDYLMTEERRMQRIIDKFTFMWRLKIQMFKTHSEYNRVQRLFPGSKIYYKGTHIGFAV
jgi:hypothetical protein